MQTRLLLRNYSIIAAPWPWFLKEWYFSTYMVFFWAKVCCWKRSIMLLNWVSELGREPERKKLLKEELCNLKDEISLNVSSDFFLSVSISGIKFVVGLVPFLGFNDAALDQTEHQFSTKSSTYLQRSLHRLNLKEKIRI